MNNLSKDMQKRLEKWQKNTITLESNSKIKTQKCFNRSGKNDYGDATSMQEWEEEFKKSQTRK